MAVRRSKNRFLPAKNFRLVSVAERNSKALEQTGLDNVRNAIEATGFPVTIYNPLQNGRRCTCSSWNRKLLDEQGRLDQSTIDQLLTGSDNGIEEYGDGDPQQAALDRADTTLLENYTILGPNVNQQKALDQEQLEIENDVQGLDEELGLDDERTTLKDARACAVCFGTGYVGGYSIPNGWREVIDVTYENAQPSAGLTIDNQSQPAAWYSATDTTLAIQVVIPRSVQWLATPRLFNNKQVVEPNQWSLSYQGQVLDGPGLQALATGLPVVLVLTINGSKPLKFTHLELQGSMTPLNMPLKADFPEINRLVNTDQMNALSQTTIIVPGQVLLNRFAVVIDQSPRLGRHWLVDNILPRKNQFGTIFDQTLSARSVDLYELTMLLRPLMPELIPIG